MSNPRELTNFKRDPYELERYRNELLNSMDLNDINLLIDKINLFLDKLDSFIGNTQEKRQKTLRSIWFIIEGLKERGIL